jgi:subtilase family serine protease
MPYAIKDTARAHRGLVPPPLKSCGCFEPAQFQAFYGLGPLYAGHYDGTGVTIAIVECFGSPTIRADLATFDAAFKLPRPPRFTIIAPAGAVRWKANAVEQGWADETSLDVEYAHAIAPGANILLVETPVDETEGPAGFKQIIAAENYVVSRHLGQVISQSFGATEETFGSGFARKIAPFRTAYEAAARAGVTVVSAAGDNGATSPSNIAGTLYYTRRVNSWPSSDPLVTSVGGLELSLNSHGIPTHPPAVWNETDSFGSPSAGGGGESAAFWRPSFQDLVATAVGGWRGTPDVSMSASAFNNGALVYENFPGASGWTPIGGTSEATPQFAGIVAIADQYAKKSLGDIEPALYAIGLAGDPGLVQVTRGNNSVDFSQKGKHYNVVGYVANSGRLVTPAVWGLEYTERYNMASGLGTVYAANFVPELVREAGILDAPSPSPLAATAGHGRHRFRRRIVLLGIAVVLVVGLVVGAILLIGRRRDRSGKPG